MQRTTTFAIIAGFALAAASMSVEAQKGENQGAGGQERYSVTASEEEGFVMVEQRSGRTWMLEYSIEDEPAWLPISRIDDPAEGKAWREQRDEKWEQREREERREATARRMLETKKQRLISLLSQTTEKLRSAENTLLDSAAEFAEDDPRILEAKTKVELLREASRELKQQLKDIADELQNASATTTRNDGQSTAGLSGANELLPLLIEEEQLLQSHGLAHPKVLEVRKKIELVREFQKDAENREELDAMKHELLMKREMFPLLIEEKLLLLNHGPTHPKVQKVRLKIEETKKHLDE